MPMPRRSLCLLLLAANGVYHANLRPLSSGDSLPAALIPISLMTGHGVSLDGLGPWVREHVPGAFYVVERRGRYFSAYPPATGVIAAPFYAPPVLALGVLRWDPGAQVTFARIWEKFVAAFLASAAVVLMLLLLERLVRPPWAWGLTLLFAFGTNVWATASQALWQHTPGVLAAVACLYCLVRALEEGAAPLWAVGAGICAGAAVLIRPTNVTLCAGAGAALVWRGGWRAAFGFAVPAAAGCILGAAYNLAVFGTLWGGWTEGLTNPLLPGLAGILLSPGRGLLIYCPAAAFALAGAFAAGVRERAIALGCGVFIAGQLLVVAKWPVWFGGYCWGPRLLTEIAPAAIVLLALGTGVLDRSPLLRRALLAAAVWCVFIQALGTFCYPKGHWDHTPRPVDTDRAWDWTDNPIVRTVRGGVAWEPYAILYTRLTRGPAAAAAVMQQLGIAPF